MPPKNRNNMADACGAMKHYGISEADTKAALKQLLKVYENHWELIIDDNYRALLEFILDNNNPKKEILEHKEKGPSICESKLVKFKKKEAPSYDKTEVAEPPNKRYCTRQQKKHALSPLEYSTSCLEVTPSKRAHHSDDDRCSESEESEDSQPLVRRSSRSRQVGEILVSGNNLDPVHQWNEQLEDSTSDFDSCNVDEDSLKYLEVESSNADNRYSVSDFSQFDVASSLPRGEMKIPLICNSSLQSDCCLPDFDAAVEMVDERCIKSYIPGERFLDYQGNNCSSTLDTNIISRDVPAYKNSNAQVVLARKCDYQGNTCSALSFPSELFLVQNLIKFIPHIPKHIDFGCFEGLHSLTGFTCKDIENICRQTLKRLKVFQGRQSSMLWMVEAAPPSLGVVKAIVCIDDITRGEERVKISLEDGRNAEDLPTFFYIPQNLVYQNADVKFALAHISYEGCCSHCYGDCLASQIPCACATEAGGQFAYTPGRLLKEKLLEKCISLKREPKQHLYSYCRECPLERSKNERSSVACKGHLLRKFIKECWSKCGCNKNCGNRIVQQGIGVKLQVFLTPEGKGWGLRTLEDLPRGAFVCEYVGEIVTISELREREVRSAGKKHTCNPVLLDANWGSKDVLKDEEALCLDAAVYGNAARFINHRCSDAALIEIPVEVETPDLHYYHLALFTTRNVAAMEELTWDYGIDFDDEDQSVKAFQCLCGSPFCRDRNDMKRGEHLRTYVRRQRGEHPRTYVRRRKV